MPFINKVKLTMENDIMEVIAAAKPPLKTYSPLKFLASLKLGMWTHRSTKKNRKGCNDAVFFIIHLLHNLC